MALLKRSLHQQKS